MEEIKVSEMLQADSINKDDSVMIIQEGVNKKAGGSIQTATGTSLSLTSVADTCKVKSDSKNLFDKDTAPIQAWIFDTANTKIIASANGKSTYIPCKPSTIYTISKVADVRFQVATTSTTPAIDVAYSDYIENNTASSITITTGASAKYLVIYYWHNSSTITEQAVLDTLQVEEGNTATSYNPYNTNIIVRTKNLITNIIKGYALSGNTGEIASNPERAVSDFIKVEGGETYTRSGYTTSGLVWYKADKTRISNDNSNPVTAPANAVYVRLGINTTADYSQAQFEKGTTATSYVKGENQEITLTPQEEKVAFTYDSLTNILSNGSVTIEYNTQSRLLNNDDTTAIKEYVDDIIEEGSNDKGNYIKYRNGTMICTSRTTYTNLVVGTASGSCYSNDANIFIDFPEAFISRPVVSLQVTGTTTGWLMTFTATGTPEIRTDGFRIFRTTSRTSSTYYVDMIAIGRWR